MERVIIKTVSTVEAVSAMLESDIYSLHFKMGEKIKESDLVERYNVSRNTLRESLAYLSSKGLLEKVANKGIFVKEIKPSDVEEIFMLRELLEAEAIRRIYAKEELPANLRMLAEEVSLYDPIQDANKNRIADIAFHRGLVEAAGSPRLMDMYDNLLYEIKLCVFQGQVFFDGTIDNIVLHFNILRALEEHNLDQALRHLSLHIKTVIRDYQIALTEYRKAHHL